MCNLLYLLKPHILVGELVKSLVGLLFLFFTTYFLFSFSKMFYFEIFFLFYIQFFLAVVGLFLGALIVPPKNESYTVDLFVSFNSLSFW